MSVIGIYKKVINFESRRPTGERIRVFEIIVLSLQRETLNQR